MYWILISCVFSCDIPRKKLTFNHKEKESMNNDSTILKNLELKNYFAPYGNDSLLMIPDWVLGNLYESPLEPYHKNRSYYGYLFRMVVAFSAIKNLTLWCYPRIINK